MNGWRRHCVLPPNRAAIRLRHAREAILLEALLALPRWVAGRIVRASPATAVPLRDWGAIHGTAYTYRTVVPDGGGT